MKVIIGSKNPVKLQVTKEVFAEVFPSEEIEFDTHDAASGVSEQPYGRTETKTGAYNRALDCQSAVPDADFWVGLEGGIEIDEDEYWVSAWMCVIGKDERVGYGRTSSFALPPAVVERLKAGDELGHADDKVFKQENSKQKGGAVAIMTDGKVTRVDLYRDALRFALLPFTKPDLYT